MSEPERVRETDPDPDELLPPFDSDVEIHPIEEDPAVIAAIENDTTVPGLDGDTY